MLLASCLLTLAVPITWSAPDSPGEAFFSYTVDMYPPVDKMLGGYEPDKLTLDKMTPIGVETPNATNQRPFAVAASIFCNDKHRFDAKTCLARFVAPLKKNVAEAEEHGFEVLIYVSNDMKETVRQECPSCTLHVMPGKNITGTDGMMWRFLAANLKQYTFVAMVDLDESWSWIWRWQAALQQSKSSQTWAWGRLLPSRSSDFKIAAKAPVAALNYATMVGSHLIAQPKNLLLDIRDAAARYVSLRLAAAKTAKPWRSAPGEHDTVFNMPIGEHVHGWGNLPGIYGFDEGFLKRVVYGHVVRRGQLASFDQDGQATFTIQGGGPTGAPGENAYVQADLAYVRSFSGNEVMIPGNEGMIEAARRHRN